MSIKRTGIAVGLGIVFFIVICSSTLNAQECRVVRIHTVTAGITMSLEIEPLTLSISPGGCVIWFNRGPTINARISFMQGEKCQKMTRSPSGFTLDEAMNCYITEYIPLGGTSSLVFSEAGTYEYEVETADGMKKTGRIIVRE